jgi:putative hydrolase of the HAD superfamily
VITAVFFDIDDTLVDHSTAMKTATAALYASLPPRRTWEDFNSSWRASHMRHYPRFIHGEISYEEASRLRVRESLDARATDATCDRIFQGYLADYERHWTLLADALACLDALSRLSLGVISNGRSREQVRKLVNLGIHNRFEVVVVSEQVGVAKPDRRIFNHACEAMGVPPGRAVYVGDSYDLDASAAVSAGLRGIWLNRAGAVRPVCEVPSIRSLEGLVASAGLE